MYLGSVIHYANERPRTVETDICWTTSSTPRIVPLTCSPAIYAGVMVRPALTVIRVVLPILSGKAVFCWALLTNHLIYHAGCRIQMAEGPELNMRWEYRLDIEPFRGFGWLEGIHHFHPSWSGYSSGHIHLLLSPIERTNQWYLDQTLSMLLGRNSEWIVSCPMKKVQKFTWIGTASFPGSPESINTEN